MIEIKIIWKIRLFHGGKKQTTLSCLSIYRVRIMENPSSEVEGLILIVDDWRQGWLEDVKC
jgi:hypothetical protein